jgi:hypothetical protein
MHQNRQQDPESRKYFVRDIVYNNSFDQPIKYWVKMVLKLFRIKCKVKEQVLFGQHINETK